MATELVQSIARPYDVGGNQLTLTASVGVSVAGEDCQDPDRMLKNADVALYRAKTDGRNAFRFYDPSMDNHLEAKRDLERAVRNALARGEFEVHYQPIVDVRSERTCGFEALMRWRHREKGPPAALGVYRHRRGGGLHRPARRMGAAQGLRRRRRAGRLTCGWR